MGGDDCRPITSAVELLNQPVELLGVLHEHEVRTALVLLEDFGPRALPGTEFLDAETVGLRDCKCLQRPKKPNQAVEYPAETACFQLLHSPGNADRGGRLDRRR